MANKQRTSNPAGRKNVNVKINKAELNRKIESDLQQFDETDRAVINVEDGGVTINVGDGAINVGIQTDDLKASMGDFGGADLSSCWPKNINDKTDVDIASGIDGDMADFDGLQNVELKAEIPKGFLKKLVGKLTCSGGISDLPDVDIDGDMAETDALQNIDLQAEIPKGFLKKLVGKLSCSSKISDLTDVDIAVDIDGDMAEIDGLKNIDLQTEIPKGFLKKLVGKLSCSSKLPEGLPEVKVPQVNVNIELQKHDMCASGDGLFDVDVRMAKTPIEGSDLKLVHRMSSIQKKVFE